MTLVMILRGLPLNYHLGTHPINKRLMLRVGLSLSWVNNNYVTAFFGVTAQQASASAFNTFSA